MTCLIWREHVSSERRFAKELRAITFLRTTDPLQAAEVGDGEGKRITSSTSENTKMYRHDVNAGWVVTLRLDIWAAVLLERRGRAVQRARRTLPP